MSESVGSRLSDVLDEFDVRLGQIDGVVVVDRVKLEASGAPKQHKQVTVDAPTTDNRDEYRDRGLARVTDTVRVSLAYRVRASNQKKARNEALDLEETIRAWLVDSRWHPEWHVTYVNSTRQAGAQAAEWWLSEQTFRVTRDADLGG